MSTIDRYKKKGGFIQLLQLIETSGTAKQDKFLQMIAEEDGAWESALRAKMLSMDRILNWPEAIVAEIMTSANELTLATAMVGLGEPVKVRVFKFLSHGQQRRVTAIMDEKRDSNAAEVTAAYVKIISDVREMIKTRRFKIDAFDPDLEIHQDIENLLAQGVKFASSQKPNSNDHPQAALGNVTATTPPSPVHLPIEAAPVATPAPQSTLHKQLHDDMVDLQKRVQFLTQENNTLRQRVRTLESKLEQIKKIA